MTKLKPPPFLGHELVLLAPGVWGFTREDGPSLVIPMIIAAEQGSGDVGRYLDSLPRGRRIVVEAVTSERLAGMLIRRDFVFDENAIYDPDTEEVVDGFVREAEVSLA